MGLAPLVLEEYQVQVASHAEKDKRQGKNEVLGTEMFDGGRPDRERSGGRGPA